jgi:class 3 adenylate cyclase
MALVERIEGIDWSRYHLPDEPTVRIGLHAGPVYRRENRVIGKQDVLGSHVNLAARIEPVATPGSAFASEHFAAELAIDGGDRFACEYMGVQELAKRFGQAPLYRLSRAVARS